MKLHFAPEPGNSQAQVVLRCQPHLEELGIEFVDVIDDADLLLVQQTHHAAQSLIDLRMPTVILERIDGCQLTAKVRKWIQLPHVLAVIKNCTFADPQLHNTSPTWRHHESLILRELGREIPPRKVDPISDEDLSKIKLGFTYAAYDKLRPFTEEFDMGADRPIDVFFAGTVDYGDELITWHRKQAVKAIRELPLTTSTAKGRPYSADQYRNLMRSSKIVVSPWGWGELCYRDYEALLSGCYLIKPYIEHVSDALPVVNWCAQWPQDDPRFSGMAEHCECFAARQTPYSTENVRKSCLLESKPETVANRLASILNGCLAAV